MYSQNVYQNQRDLCSSIDIELVLTSREECEWNAFSLGSTFCSRDIVDSTRLPWGLQQICGPLWIILPFDRLLSCAKRSLDLCIFSKFIFLYLLYIPFIIVLFTHFAHTNIFSYVYHNYHANIFFLSLMMPLISVKLEI